MVPTILARSLKLTLSCGVGSLASEPMTSPSPDNGNGEELWVSCYHGAHNSRKVPQTHPLASGHAPCHSGNELGTREGNLHLGGIYGETQELELP